PKVYREAVRRAVNHLGRQVDRRAHARVEQHARRRAARAAAGRARAAAKAAHAHAARHTASSHTVTARTDATTSSITIHSTAPTANATTTPTHVVHNRRRRRVAKRRETKVGQLNVPLAINQHIVWLHVPMHHVHLVQLANHVH